uniref:Apoptosis inducing factor mitochondria associated 4 n=1 Tax=Neogobius melanostomus TaxID=47308 RepID=A0A8C6SF68_9GOBI
METCQERGPDDNPEELTELVCQETDLKDGEMKAVEVGEAKLLIVRAHGQYTAIGSRCSHYGAPLIKGVLLGDRVRCPFHGACFNVKTGDIEDYPGLDSLPLNCCCPLILFAGPASLVCAETLRQNEYKGRIIMITKDLLPPFDKPKLSKVTNKILLRSHDFFHEFGIELWTQKEVISVNTADKVVKLSDGSLQRYDQLLISTGSCPLNCPGWDLEGVKLLQTYEDAKEIHTLSLGQKAVVVGTSFIGMEAASYLSDKAASVSVVGTSAYPYERSLGPKIGQMTLQMMEEQGVKFYMKSGVSEIRGHNGKVKEVVLKDGRVLEADVVILGIGVIPNSDFLQDSGVEIDPKKAVIVNKLMMTNVPGVFSAGDVTSFPLSIRGDQMVSIGHWQMSHAQGRVAALNMLNKKTEIKSVPFFWTVLLGKSIRYTGYNEGYTEIIFKGTVEERKFLAFYIKENVVVAAASLMFDPAVARLAEMMATGQRITKTQALAEDLSWLQM